MVVVAAVPVIMIMVVDAAEPVHAKQEPCTHQAAQVLHVLPGPVAGLLQLHLFYLVGLFGQAALLHARPAALCRLQITEPILMQAAAEAKNLWSGGLHP